MRAAGAAVLTLFAARAAPFWGSLLKNPSSLDGESLRLLAAFAAAPLALAAALWVIAWGLGRRLLRLQGVPAAALGMGLLGQAVFLLAAAGLLHPLPLAVLTAAFAALAVPGLRRPAISWPRLGALEGAAAGLLVFAAAACALTALAPPTAWDSLAYHLALPELNLKAGRLLDVPWMIHSHWPHLPETLYALPLAAGRDGAAALLHLGAAALLVAGVYAAGGWCPAVLVAAQPALLREAGTANSDAFTALFAFGSAVLLALWESSGGEKVLIAAGLLAGLCAASKLTGVAALAAWTLYLAWKTRRVRPAAVFAAAGLVMVGPWLLREWMSTGDPIWPFLSARDFATRYLTSNRWSAPPVWLLIHDGPLFLLVPLLGLFALSRRRPPMDAVERMLWVAFPFYAFLAFHHNEGWRFLMPVWPALALAAGRAASGPLKHGGARAVAAAALIAAGAWPIAAQSPSNELFAVLGVRPVSAPRADRREHWSDRSLDGLTGFYRDARAVLPPGAKVLLWREIRGYGAGFDYQWGDPMNQALLDYRSIADPDALYARLKALGVTHVLENEASGLYQEDPGYYDRRTLALMSECLRRHGRVALTRGGFVLHQLL